MNIENVAYATTLLGFLTGLVVGWHIRDDKAVNDHNDYVAYMADTVEGRMNRDGWSA